MADQQLSREQLESVQVIVTTPEKWFAAYHTQTHIYSLRHTFWSGGQLAIVDLA